MDEKNDNEKLIGKLIKKRKAENDAFTKLLNAMKTTQKDAVKRRSNNKSKS
jgi:hypothetical protein